MACPSKRDEEGDIRGLTPRTQVDPKMSVTCDYAINLFPVRVELHRGKFENLFHRAGEE
jgi:hypothetical protein